MQVRAGRFPGISNLANHLFYATGNGVVTFAAWKQGYGNCLIIDHGYGYQTLYGHMSKFKKHHSRMETRCTVNRVDTHAIAGSGTTQILIGNRLDRISRLKWERRSMRQVMALSLSPLGNRDTEIV